MARAASDNRLRLPKNRCRTQSHPRHVSYGSKADMARSNRDVCSTLESRHSSALSRCPLLCQISGLVAWSATNPLILKNQTSHVTAGTTVLSNSWLVAVAPAG